MNRRKRNFQLLLIFILTLSFSLTMSNAYGKRTKKFKRIYYFQHRLLPRWTYRSRGKFYKTMMNNDFRIFNRVAKKILGSEYAEQIKIKTYPDMKGFLIIFPEPSKVPLCYYAFVMKSGDGYRYFTYEKTHNIVAGSVGVLGGWAPGKRHQNYGSRKYNDVESFIKDLKKIMR